MADKKETADEKIERIAQEEKEAEERKAAEEAKKAEEKAAVDEAKATLESIKEQNKIMAENLKKAEKLQAEFLAAGKTPAGQGAGKTQEEKDNEEAKKLIAGTGFEDMIFPPKK